MKKKSVIIIIISAWIVIVLLAVLSFALLMSHTGMVYYLNKNIRLEYTVTEKKNVSDYFEDKYTLWALEKRIKASHLPIFERKKLYNNPSEYNIVNFDLTIVNNSDYYIRIKPRFEDTGNVRFVNKNLELLAGDDSTWVGCGPHDSTSWSFCAIEKLDSFDTEIKYSNLRSKVYAYIEDGTYIFTAGPCVSIHTNRDGVLYKEGQSKPGS